MIKKILIIEDNIGVADLISSQLNDCGYTTHVAYEGKLALEYLLSHQADLIILDYSLPDMDGKEIIQTLQSWDIDLPPFIVSTGRGDEQLAVDMMKLGAFDYLIKDRSLIEHLPDVIQRLSNNLERDAELKKAQLALKESEERFRNFVEKSSDLFIKLTKEGRFNYVSPNWEKHLGFSARELVNKCFYDLVSLEVAREFKTRITEAAQEENKQFAIEYQIAHKNGDIKYHILKGYSVVENQRIFINCIARDITDKKMADIRLARAVFRAEEKGKKRFAEELHEGLGPMISTVKMYMGKIKSIPGIQEKDLKVIGYCDQIVDDAVRQLRNLANDLMPSIINDFGLKAAIGSYTQKINEEGKAVVHFKCNARLDNLDKMTGIILYRIVTELMDSSIKHCQAQQLRINIHADAKEILISFAVKDECDIWIQSATQESTADLDIQYIKNRIESLNGTISITQPKDYGVRVTMKIPLK